MGEFVNFLIVLAVMYFIFRRLASANTENNSDNETTEERIKKNWQQLSQAIEENTNNVPENLNFNQSSKHKIQPRSTQTVRVGRNLSGGVVNKGIFDRKDNGKTVDRR